MTLNDTLILCIGNNIITYYIDYQSIITIVQEMKRMGVMRVIKESAKSKIVSLKEIIFKFKYYLF